MTGLNGMYVKGYHVGHTGRARHCHRFDRISIWTVRAAGCRWGFRLAVLLIVAWAAAGPLFNDHESWTTLFTVTTTSVMFLLVFLIQNVQNRELKAVHLKLDELILSAKHARNELIDIEYLTEEQLDQLGRRYSDLAELQRRLRKSPEGEATPGVAVEEDRAGQGLGRDKMVEVPMAVIDGEVEGDGRRSPAESAAADARKQVA